MEIIPKRNELGRLELFEIQYRIWCRELNYEERQEKLLKLLKELIQVYKSKHEFNR